MLLRILIPYLALVNLIAFAAMGKDKRRAARHMRRTPEKRLLAFAGLGGSVGAILGMLVFRHKTKHLKFTLGLPLILLAHILIVIAAVLYL